ncbi:MAG TPA: signal peptidase I [Gammaproteobacteria bacterium]|jgi:signal peptidase I, bacterial type|nr:signal peptidase I [Gammaproteobacteria bacterium]
MAFDLALLLVIGTFATGLIWAVDALVFAPKRLADSGATPQPMTKADKKHGEPVIVEYARSFFPVLLIVLILRSFLFEPFRIPSGSMMPTLLVGDFILVNKFSYGIRLPVINTKVIDVGQPERGDVAVFKYPRQPEIDYIKRVVGLPGDRISYSGKRLWINGELIPVEKIGLYIPPGADRADPNTLELKEDLLSVEYHILISANRGASEGSFVVPEGHYFMMGDNRDNSNDSRFWGFVPEELLVGKAVMIWLNWDWSDSQFNWRRIGQFIH